MSSDPSDTSHQQAAGDAPRVGVIYNPRSHRNKGQDLDANPAPRVYVSQPGARSQLPAALENFAKRGIDLLVINGGDGTVRDVLTAGCDVFGEDWPTIAVLPKGKTNALTVDLEAPKDWSLQGAIDAYRNGGRVKRRPLVVRRKDADADVDAHADAKPLYGFIMGAGVFTIAISAGQGAHKLGAFNALAVSVTTFWTVLQTFLGSRSNIWRKGAKMDIRLGQERKPMVHSGLGEAEWRQLLFASTLENFPAGIKPFGPHVDGLKMAVLDQPSRSSLLRLPSLFRGKAIPNMAERGFHQVATDQFEARFSDRFILDGEAYDAGTYEVREGPLLEFVKPA